MKRELQLLRRIYAEQQRRKNSALSLYNKEIIHQKQMAFHRCTKRNRWVFGGNRSGKTECGAVETVWLARGIHPFRPNRKEISCWVVSSRSRCSERWRSRRCFTIWTNRG